MPHLWLRVALVFYGLGLVYAIAALARHREVLARIIVPAVGLGTVFHFVALTEAVAASGRMAPVISYQYESFLALVLMLIFFAVYWRYRTLSHGIFVFPAVFLLALTSSLAQRPPQLDTPLLRGGWLYSHIVLIFLGYAALFFSFASSLLYLVQERRLKDKKSGATFSRMPSLAEMDDVGLRSLVIGFPFMTLGLAAGAVIAVATYGTQYFSDPKVVLSLLMWVVYMVLLFSRWTAGWRGRRAALLSTATFVTATLAWAANYLNSMHRLVAP